MVIATLQIDDVYKLSVLIGMGRNEFPKRPFPGKRVDGAKAYSWLRFAVAGNAFECGALLRAIRWSAATDQEETCIA
ncbi:hypothetical protein [Rhizobium sp. CNPSo 3490]|uniref:hypothetical protein n=1 Tax=Rhizobium sp. CNPSo 3490 TaxID=3021407 RepID=UPI00254ADC89|nr:hypothetical protein [Rhizobium sp. CNPSo 3490]MDK4732252.1 hypothetical protein [Rhizobium sp. CNPSo 3490]